MVIVIALLAAVAVYGAVFGRAQGDREHYDRQSDARLKREVARHHDEVEL